MAKKMLVTAIAGKETSRPFILYATGENELPKEVVLKVEESTNQNGQPVLKLSNGNEGLIVSHQPNYILDIITGFRVDIKDVTCIVVRKFVDDLPTVTAAKKGEVY